jgi:hypothetical protein
MPPYADSSSDIVYSDGCSEGRSNSLAFASDRDPSEEHSRAADLPCLPGTHGFRRHRVGHHSLLARLSLQMSFEMGRIRLSSMSPISSHAGVRGACSLFQVHAVYRGEERSQGELGLRGMRLYRMQSISAGTCERSFPAVGSCVFDGDRYSACLALPRGHVSFALHTMFGSKC